MLHDMSEITDSLPPAALFEGFAAPAGDPGAACCGGPPKPPASPHERPGYAIRSHVAGFLDTPLGPVPVLSTRPTASERLRAALIRCGPGRETATVAPGLYAAGRPGPDSPICVTANYVLSLDALRQALDGLRAWVLVLDTRGVNVWCAAGKKSFGTAEIARRVAATRLAEVTTQRRLILPQLAAPGVSAREVKALTGFSVTYGPVRAADLPTFLAAGMRADAAMRRIDFGLAERLKLVPVEFYLAWKKLFWLSLAALVLSGLGPDVFSLGRAAARGPLALLALWAGVLAGAGLTPALLPWLPGRALAAKGLFAGAAAALCCLPVLFVAPPVPDLSGLVLLLMAASSFAAMNFTGSTPYASPTGVEREMRRYLPIQAGAAALGLILWLAGAMP